MIGLGEQDDAAVWRLDDERALVVTTDFFTPVVDDPYDYGAIAAANALSDVYAMGGTPFLGLNIAAVPPELPNDVIGEIFRGGAEKAIEGEAVIVGGHTIQDSEPKYGLIVLGFVHPDKILTKKGAVVGDILLMSKPVGTGTITTALKQEKAKPEDVRNAVKWMKSLNKNTAKLALEFGAHACTDVTGFGLLGHSRELAQASNVGLRFYFSKLPIIKGAQEYANDWIFPGGSLDNKVYYSKHVNFSPGIEEASQMLMYDAQTSGGLLLALSSDKVDSMMDRAAQLDQPLWVVGEVVEGEKIEVVT